MGIISSTPQRKLTPLQEDIKNLGNRNPFGDAELYQVYKAYFGRLEKQEKVSFLTDIGLLSENFNGDGNAEDRLVLLQAVEHKILPTNFGNRLYLTAFLRKQDTSDYDVNALSHPPVPDDDYTRVAKLEAFFDGLSNCSRRGAKKTLKVLMDCCQQHPAPQDDAVSAAANDFAYAATIQSTNKPKTLIDPMEFINIGYRIALASAFLSATTKSDDEHQDIGRFFPPEDASQQPGIQSLTKSLVNFANKRKQRMQRSSTPTREKLTLVDEDDINEWAEQVAPMFAGSLAMLIHMVFFPSRPYPPSRASFDFPSISADSSFFSEGSSPLLFSFGCMSPSLSGEFFRLYTSASDGLSFNRLQNALLGYSGPTLLIIQSGDCIFGAFTASQWKESKDFYGNTDCFLYQLLPTTAVYRPSGNGSNFMYCNPHARSRGYDQQAHGIGFGGSVDQPRLFLAESFDDCRASTQDMTFEKGALLDTKSPTFEIDNLEVWGCGGTDVVMEALGARSKQRDIKYASIQKARKVDKAAFLDDFRSGLIESKAFAHRGQIRGRESACVDDQDLNNYKLPK